MAFNMNDEAARIIYEMMNEDKVKHNKLVAVEAYKKQMNYKRNITPTLTAEDTQELLQAYRRGFWVGIAVIIATFILLGIKLFA